MRDTGATTRSMPCVSSRQCGRLARPAFPTSSRSGRATPCLRLGGNPCKESGKAWLGSLSKRGELNEILTSLGELYRRGYDVDWEGFNRPCPRRRVSLPTYPFEHRRFWIEADATARSTGPLSNGLTGVRLRSALPDAQFESTYSLQRFAYLDDHRIYGMPVLPTTAGPDGFAGCRAPVFWLRRSRDRQSAIPRGHGLAGERRAHRAVDPHAAGRFDGRVSLRQHRYKWRRYVANPHGRRGAQGGLGAQCSDRPVSSSITSGNGAPVRSRSTAIMKPYAPSGLEYGASFRAIEMLQRGSGEILTRVRLPPHLSVDGQSGLHPALLDACLHLYPALVDAYGDFTQAAEEPRRTYLPVSVERFRCAGVRAREVWVHGVRRQPGNGDEEIFTVDIAIYQDDGRFAAAIEGLSLKPLPPEALRPQAATGTADSLSQTAETGAAIRPARRAARMRRR